MREGNIGGGPAIGRYETQSAASAPKPMPVLETIYAEMTNSAERLEQANERLASGIHRLLAPRPAECDELKSNSIPTAPAFESRMVELARRLQIVATRLNDNISEFERGV